MLQLDPHARRGVAAATLLMLGFLTAWTLATPAFRAADEPTHFSAVSRLARDHTWPTRGHVHMDPAVPAAYAVVEIGEDPWANNPTHEPPTAGEGPGSPTMAELRATSTTTDAEEASSAHPPGYYAYLAVFYAALDLDQATPSGAVLALRLAGLLLLLPVPYLCAVTATELALHTRAVVAAAFTPVGWIQLLHVGASINTGNMVVLTCAVATTLLAPVITRTEISIRRALAIGIITTIGLAAKAFALCLLPMMMVAYLAAARRGGRRAWLALAVALAASLPGLALLLRSTLGGALEPPDASSATGTSVPDYAEQVFSDLSGSLWANLGYLNTPLPAVLHVPATLAAIAILVAGSWRLRNRPALLLVLHGAWIGPLTMITLWSWTYYRTNGFVDGMQGRYLTGAIVTFAVLTVAALDRWPRVLRLIPWAAVVAALGGLVFALRSFWASADPRVMLAWWPHGELVLATAAVLCATGMALLVRPLRRRRAGSTASA